MIDILERVASHLAGQKVEVILRRIQERGVGGYTRKGKNGAVRIDLDPCLPDDQFLAIFAHEAAHAKLHAPTMRPVDLARSPEERRQEIARYKQMLGIAITARIDQVIRQEEQEADDLAREWLTYAEKHQEAAGTWLSSRLEGLLTWKPDTTGDLAHKIYTILQKR